MTRTFTRRAMLGLGGGAALLPAIGGAGAARAAAVPLGGSVVPIFPVRVWDSRTDASPLGRNKLQPGAGVSIAVSAAYPDFALAVFINCSVTETEASGYLVVQPTDNSGNQGLAPTANINWWQSGQTLGNAGLVQVGSENSIDIFCRGAGATHVIIDVQGYIPYVT